ncbi:hypothetical protein ACHAQA_009897 [Verticillium albo-atrum]
MSMQKKPDMGSVLKSRIILFLIGKEHEEFRVHECVLFPLSELIHAQLTAGSEESVVDKFLWEHVEPATFADLIEYAYGGDYTTNIFPEKDIGGNTDEIYNLNEWIDQWAGKKGEVYHHGLKFVEAGVFVPDGYFPASDDDMKPVPIDEASCSATMFRHIKLYVLAQKTEIHSLAVICIYKLRQCLIRLPWHLYDEVLICDVTRHIWANTPEGEHSPLRKLWIDFILCDLDCLMDGRLVDPIRCIKNFGTDLLLAVPHGYWEQLQNVRKQKAEK